MGFERRRAHRPVGGSDEENKWQSRVDPAELTHTVVLILHPLLLQLLLISLVVFFISNGSVPEAISVLLPFFRSPIHNQSVNAIYLSCSQATLDIVHLTTAKLWQD